MAALLSKMFEPESGEGSAVIQPTEGDAYQTDTAQDAEADLDLEIQLSIHAETSVEYQLGEETGGWSNSTDLDLTLSTDALLAATGEQGGSYESDAG